MPLALVDYAAISHGPYEPEDQVSWWEVLYLALYLEGQTRLALQHRAPQSLAQSKSHRAAQASGTAPRLYRPARQQQIPETV